MKKSPKSFQTLALEFKNAESSKLASRAFTELYNSMQFSMTKYIYTLVHDYHNSAEVYMLTMTKIYENIKSYDENFKFTTWAYTIAKNESLQFNNRNSRSNNEICYLDIIYTADNLSQRDADDDSEVYSKLLSAHRDRLAIEVDFENFMFSSKNEYDDITKRKYEIALGCIEELPTKYRELIEDRFIKNVKQVELEEKYGMNLNTIKTRSRKAIDLLNQLYRIRTKSLYDLV